MSIKIDTIGLIPFDLDPDDNFQVTIDISDFVDDDVIDAVVFSAEDEDGVDATADVVDDAKCAFTDTVIQPYIKGGTDGKSYIVKCLATMDNVNADEKAFYVKWDCNQPSA